MKEEEIKILEEIKEIKTKLVEEIEAVIEKYLNEYGQKNSVDINKLGKIDIIAILELVKFRFYDKGKRENLLIDFLKKDVKISLADINYIIDNQDDFMYILLNNSTHKNLYNALDIIPNNYDYPIIEEFKNRILNIQRKTEQIMMSNILKDKRVGVTGKYTHSFH